MTELSKRGQRVRRDIERMGDTIGKAGKTLTASVTVPVAGMAAASVKTAADFEASMSQVAATMGKTRDQITDLTDLAQRMGATTAFSASEAAEGINILAMAGLNAAQISDSLGTVLNLAAAGAMDMGSAASYVVGAVKGFGDEMGNASRYADLMAKGATLANTDVQALGEAVSYGAATAAGYSQTVDSMTLALLRMAEQNVTGQTAATSLNRAMADLYSPTQEAKAALDRLGVSAYNADGSARDFNTVVDELAGSLRTMSEEEANALKNTIFTTNGMNAFNKMTASSAARVQELWSGLGDAGGSAAQQAATQLDNLNGQITILKSAVEGAAIAFGNRMLPYIKKAAEYAQGLMEQINGLSDAQVDSVIRWAGMAAAAGPVLVVTGKVITGFTKMIPLVKMAATGF
ncbi:MAG: phage tail tape measure protein, partial [Lachnospiraceae bacterium]|nr:phage tail tape measure protein [Lachnospiraceae bacterium]